MSTAPARQPSSAVHGRVRAAQRRLLREALRFPDPRALSAPIASADRDPMATARVPTYVIHWRAPEWCAETVTSLLAQVGVDLDVCVLDNSADEHDVSEELRRRLPPSVQVVDLQGNPGYAGAANRAIDMWQSSFPECDVALIICHDCVLQPDAVARLLCVLQTHPDVGIAGPAMTSIAEATDRTDAIGSEPVARAWVEGACMAIRRGIVESGVRFRPVMHSYIEDIAFCLDADVAGWRTAEAPAARAASHGSRLGDRRWRLITRNTIHLASIRRGVLGVLLATASFTLALGLHALAAIDPRRTNGARRSSRRRLREMAVGVADGLGRVTQGTGECERRRDAELV